MAETMQWEYTRLSLALNQTPSPWSETPAFNADDWMEKLQSLGAQGWEAIGPVSLYDRSGQAQGWLMLKRPVT